MKRKADFLHHTVPLQSWLPPAWFGLHVGFGKAPQLESSLQLLCSLYKGSWNHALDPSAHPQHNLKTAGVDGPQYFTDSRMHLIASSADIYWMPPWSMAKQRCGQVIQWPTEEGLQHKPMNSEPLSFYQWHFQCHSPTSPPYLWNVGYLLK